MRENVTWALRADQLTRLASVRDRSAEQPGGPVVVRAMLVSQFCRVCATRRGEMVTQQYIDGNRRYVATAWHNPCGHVDTFKGLITEAELSCAAPECVLLVSDGFYPYCSLDCVPA